MRFRFAISLALLLALTCVSAFGMACETSCELMAASNGQHHSGMHPAHPAMAGMSHAAAMDMRMDPGMEMPASLQPAPTKVHVAGVAHSCTGPLLHSQCTLEHLSANRPTSAYQAHFPAPAPAMAADDRCAQVTSGLRCCGAGAMATIAQRTQLNLRI